MNRYPQNMVACRHVCGKSFEVLCIAWRYQRLDNHEEFQRYIHSFTCQSSTHMFSSRVYSNAVIPSRITSSANLAGSDTFYCVRSHTYLDTTHKNRLYPFPHSALKSTFLHTPVHFSSPPATHPPVPSPSISHLLHYMLSPRIPTV